MKKQFLLVFGIMSLLLVFGNQANAQVNQMLGMWKTIDDETGEAKSYVKIFKATDGYYYGKITKLLISDPDTKCTACTGSNKDKPVVGLLIITKMEADGDDLEDGKILDPGNGEIYNCTLSLDDDDKDKLIVRGSIDRWGIAGRSQTWIRLK